jgi:ketosteroid isomerase-like protein
MNTKQDPIAVDRQFFVWLTEANVRAVDRLLMDDFLLIDVMRGGEVPKAALLAAMQSGDLKFESIEPADVRVRSYAGTAIVTGRTKMRIKFQETGAEVHSRYTHVYVTVDGQWRLAAGQGTPIAES